MHEQDKLDAADEETRHANMNVFDPDYQFWDNSEMETSQFAEPMTPLQRVFFATFGVISMTVILATFAGFIWGLAWVIRTQF